METAKHPSGGQERQYAFVFVCQQGELELKALLLAASLRRFLRCRYQLIAAIPTPAREWGTPSDATISALREMGVRVVPIANPLGRDYAFANKIACVQIAVEADKLVFLDSDILCIRDFADEPRFDLALNLKPADHMTYSVDEDIWRKVYAIAGVPLPAIRLPATASQEFSLPYFNAGFVSLDAKLNLGTAWEECFRRLSVANDIANINSPPPHQAFWIDQVSLSVAIAKLQLPYDCLDERYNFPANLKPLDTRRLPYFCHYHSAEVIEQEPMLLQCVHSLMEETNGIRDRASVSPNWRFLLDSPRSLKKHSAQRLPPFLSALTGRPAAKAHRVCDEKPNILITGIPRSGTSYLCNLLHRYSNCVVVNEPVELLTTLAQELVPWSIPRLYRKLRSDICAGRPISNKLHQGAVTHDTRVSAETSDYIPAIDSEDFVLGTKNTIAYLTRLEGIRRVLPDVRVIVCIRDPFDTIASWKTSFPHLRDADISGLPVGNEREPWLTAAQRQALRQIIEIEDLAQRRARRWHYFAERILDQGHTVTLVRYDEMVTNPAQTLTKILSDLPKGKLREPVQPSRIRSAAHRLNASECQAIRAICSQSAAALGLLGDPCFAVSET